MRQILPIPLEEIDPLSTYALDARPKPSGRPWVLVNMIASLDGATALDGKSGGLGGPADKAVFRALRALPDAILVGAGTARVETYGPVKLDDAARAARNSRGQSGPPRLVLVSGRLDLDPTGTMFTESIEPPIVFTTSTAPAKTVAAFAGVAEIVSCGETTVDLRSAMAHLDAIGIGTVLCEGGPTLNGQMLAADLVDEWCQSIAPMLVVGNSDRVAVSAANGGYPPAHMRINRVLEQDGYLFIQALRDR
ncbi:RibD Pyrimidine reductase, riboflavin biosynthesis [Acidimicrobiia bacterium]